MTIILVIAAILACLWILIKVRNASKNKIEAYTQYLYLTAFLENNNQRDWLQACTSSKEVIETGQDRLWEEAQKLHMQLNELNANEWKMLPGDD